MKGLLFFLCVLSITFMLVYLYSKLEELIKNNNKQSIKYDNKYAISILFYIFIIKNAIRIVELLVSK